MSKITQSVALITGASKRIGKALALTLVSQGYAVALHYNQSAREAQTLANQIESKGGMCRLFQADLTKFEEVRALIKKVKSEFGRCDVLINNASVFVPSALRKGDVEALQMNLSIHVSAPYILISDFARMFKKGHVINLLDTAVSGNRITHVPYLISKKALQSLTELAAVELAPAIRVNAIAPGFILPPKGMGKAAMNQRIRQIPLRKNGSEKNIVQAMQYLLENDFVTGQTLYVDGGESLV